MRRVGLVAATLVCGCSLVLDGSSHQRNRGADASVDDAGSTDAGMRADAQADTGASDAGRVDAALEDAGPPPIVIVDVRVLDGPRGILGVEVIAHLPSGAQFGPTQVTEADGITRLDVPVGGMVSIAESSDGGFPTTYYGIPAAAGTLTLVHAGRPQTLTQSVGASVAATSGDETVVISTGCESLTIPSGSPAMAHMLSVGDPCGTSSPTPYSVFATRYDSVGGVRVFHEFVAVGAFSSVGFGVGAPPTQQFRVDSTDSELNVSFAYELWSGSRRVGEFERSAAFASGSYTALVPIPTGPALTAEILTAATSEGGQRAIRRYRAGAPTDVVEFTERSLLDRIEPASITTVGRTISWTYTDDHDYVLIGSTGWRGVAPAASTMARIPDLPTSWGVPAGPAAGAAVRFVEDSTFVRYEDVLERRAEPPTASVVIQTSSAGVVGLAPF